MGLKDIKDESFRIISPYAHCTMDDTLKIYETGKSYKYDEPRQNEGYRFWLYTL